MTAPGGRRVAGAILAGVIFVAGVAGAKPRPAAPPAASSITSVQADSILWELRQIRTLLEKNLAPTPRPAIAAPPPERQVTLPDSLAAFALGKSDAPVTLVEFTDYQCPYCRQFHVSTLEKLKQEFIDTGQLRFISCDLPLDFHDNAFNAAVAARCAGEQGKFWELRNAMIVNSDRLDRDDLLTYARDLGLDMPRFGACLDEERFGPEIRGDLADAQAAGVSATPTFVLGKTTPGGIQGVVIVGARPVADFESRIRKLLAN